MSFNEDDEEDSGRKSTKSSNSRKEGIQKKKSRRP